MKKNLIIGISGASGAIFGVRLLEILRECNVTTHLIISKAAEITIGYEIDQSVKDIRKLAQHNYPVQDIGAICASGSFRTDGMIIAPCSMNSCAQIALGMTNNLLTRTADVTLKERRRLVLMTRETPLTNSHLENMLHISKMGGIIAPPVPAFYSKPHTIDDIVTHTLGRVLDLFDIETPYVKRWRHK